MRITPYRGTFNRGDEEGWNFPHFYLGDNMKEEVFSNLITKVSSSNKINHSNIGIGYEIFMFLKNNKESEYSNIELMEIFKKSKSQIQSTTCLLCRIGLIERMEGGGLGSAYLNFYSSDKEVKENIDKLKKNLYFFVRPTKRPRIMKNRDSYNNLMSVKLY